jgi:hypothetical protein
MAGIMLLVLGLFLLAWSYAAPDSVPFWASLFAPFILGVGIGMLLRVWHETRRVRREARAWAEDHPGEEAEKPVWRPPEDDPNWVAWSRKRVDNPENPTNDTDEEGPRD